MFFSHAFDKTRLPRAEDALPGRDVPQAVPERHAVLGTPLRGPFPENLRRVHFGLGCFWGAERLFWRLDGVYTTAVGYAGGITPNPTYREVCSGRTGHAETVLVVYDPGAIGFESLLGTFWENHDPTQGMRQGNDVGTPYRSVIHAHDADQLAAARSSRTAYGAALSGAGHGGAVTTAVDAAPAFYYAEEYHQQYLHKNPGGYCGLAGTGVICPTASS